MKYLLRLIILNSVSLYAVSSIFSGLVFTSSLSQLLIAGTVFTLINLLIKPIIKLFLLPINLVTLGLFRWISNVIVLFILIRIISSLTIASFISSPVSYAGFIIPSIHLSIALSLIISSFLLSLVYNLLDWLLVDN